MTLLEQPPTRGTRAGALERIQASLAGLAPAQRAVADRVLSDPAQAIALSIGEFADLCRVAQPTVSRFCRSVGFASYAALRLGVMADFAADGAIEGESRGTSPIGLGHGLRSDATLERVVEAFRLASRVEIWPSPELAGAGELLAARLAELDIAASSTLAPCYWPMRAKALPAGAVTVLLGTDGGETSWTPAVAAARGADAQIIYLSAQPVARLVKMVDMFVPLPDDLSSTIAGLVMAEAASDMVRDISGYAGPDGPASPWRAWPHSETVYLQTPEKPIPAILLRQPNPQRRRTLVIMYAGFRSTKEIVAPPCSAIDRVTPSMVAALLNAGHNVLLPDAPAHGARKRPWEDSAEMFRAGIRGDGPDYLERARTETPALIDATLRLGVVSSATQIAVAGQSAGGMQALLKLAGDPRIACGVAIMPICDLGAFSQFTDLRQEPRLIRGGPNAAMAEHLAPRPLLLIGGGKDTTAPAHLIQAFTRSIAPAYKRAGVSNHLTYLQLDDVAHKFNAKQVEAMLDHFEHHLARKATSKSAQKSRR